MKEMNAKRLANAELIRRAAEMRVHKLYVEIGQLAANHGDSADGIDTVIVRLLGLTRELECDVDELGEYTGVAS